MDRRRMMSVLGALALASAVGVCATAAEKTKATKVGCGCCGDACVSRNAPAMRRRPAPARAATAAATRRVAR